MNEPTKIVIVGAGGLGREVLATIQACNLDRKLWDVVGFVDNDSTLAGKKVSGFPVLGGDEWCGRNNKDSLRFICAIGDPKARRRVAEKLSGLGCRFAQIVHPEVRVPASVTIGPGTVIMAGTRFTTDAAIGSHVVVYLNCSITHDVQIGDYCLVASGCNFGGGAVVEEGVTLGAGVNILPRIRIGAWATVGAGSVVTQDIPAQVTAVGVPCRVLSANERRAK